METSSVVAGLLALLWGFAYAVLLWRTRPGRWLRVRRTWLIVVIGVGVDLMVLRLALGLEEWLLVGGVIAASGVGIVGFSLFETEYGEHRDEMGKVERR